MSASFASALEFVHTAVSQMQARGLPSTASKQVLASLAALGGAETAAEPPKPAQAVAAVPDAERATSKAEPPAVAAERRPPTPILPPRTRSGNAAADLEALRAAMLASPLFAAESCGKAVFGTGSAEADVMFIGDVPGEEEAAAGEPFVGLAGQLLTKIIETMGYRREQVYLANLLKCRVDSSPSGTSSRKPTAAEMQSSVPFLEEQIAIVQPRVIVALGATVMDGLLGLTDPMARLRGRWHEFKGIPLMATYHPSYLLRNQALGEKRKVWEDMLLVLERLERPVTDKQRAFFLPKR